jgi:hypothetical protein
VLYPPAKSCTAPVFLIGTEPLRADAGSRLGEADRMRRPQGGLDAAAGSGTIERQEDGCPPPSRATIEPG